MTADWETERIARQTAELAAVTAHYPPLPSYPARVRRLRRPRCACPCSRWAMVRDIVLVATLAPVAVAGAVAVVVVVRYLLWVHG